MKTLKIDLEAAINEPEYEENFLQNRQKIIQNAIMNNDQLLIKEIIELDKINIKFLQEGAKNIKDILDNIGKLRGYL